MNRTSDIVRRWASTVKAGCWDRPHAKASIRRALVRLARTALQVRSSSLLLRGIRKVVVISPHPDDETLGCGGTIVRMLENRIPIRVVYITDGSGSHPGHLRFGPAEISAMRVAEAMTATKRLGIESGQVSFLGAKDGTLRSMPLKVRNDLVSRIAGILKTEMPDVVLLPSGDDGSTEHDAVYRFTKDAVKTIGLRTRLLEFPIWSWRNPHLMIKQVLRARWLWSVDIRSAQTAKLGALAAYETQLQPLPPDIHALLSPDFTREFSFPEEYFFER